MKSKPIVKFSGNTIRLHLQRQELQSLVYIFGFTYGFLIEFSFTKEMVGLIQEFYAAYQKLDKKVFGWWCKGQEKGSVIIDRNTAMLLVLINRRNNFTDPYCLALLGSIAEPIAQKLNII